MGLDAFKSWQNLPPKDWAKLANDYRTWLQFMCALREKNWAARGLFIYPQVNHQWGSGIVREIIDNGGTPHTFTLIDGTNPLNDWSAPGPLTAGDFVGKLWAGGSAPSTPYRPTDFDVIISFDDNDPSMQIRAKITDNTDGGSGPARLTFLDYNDYITASCIKDINAAGKKFWIIKHQGYWWGDHVFDQGRWIDWPNESEEDRGTTRPAKDHNDKGRLDRVIITSEFGYVSPEDGFKGKDILFYDDDQRLYRAPILANRKATIEDTTDVGDIGKTVVLFNSIKKPPGDGANYSIVKTGAMAWPRKPFGKAALWYYGKLDNYVIHDADDPLDPVLRSVIIADSITFNDINDPGHCSDCIDNPSLCIHNAFYQDVISAYDAICEGAFADRLYTPFYFKAIAGAAQSGVEDFLGDFAPPSKTNDIPFGENPKQKFTPALLFNLCGINTGTSIVLDKDGSGHYHATINPKYNGKTVYFTVLKQKKHGNAAGMDRHTDISIVSNGLIDLGTTLSDAADELANPLNYSDVGQAVYWTFGWTRYYQKRFRFMYERSNFIPDLDIAGEPILPPAIDFGLSGCAGVGQWIKRPASTNLMIFDDHGYVIDGPVFKKGDYATYSGESWMYPTEDGGVSIDGTSKFYDRFVETKHPGNNHPHQQGTQGDIESDTVGEIVSFTDYSLTAAKDWWKYWYDGGELRVDSGTATSASDTSLTDSTKITGTAGNCFWAATRFLGFDFPWQGFIVEIDHTDAQGGTNTYKLPITGCDPATATIYFESIGIGFSANDVYRIREPGTTLNRYRGKKVAITPDNGNTFTLTILFSDRDTLYFDKSELMKASPGGLGVGWVFRIIEYYPGGTYLWDGKSWVAPIGADPRHGVNFRPEPENNIPDYVLDYGKVRKGDYRGPWLPKELYQTLNALIWSVKSTTCTNRNDEYNTKFSGSEFYNTYQYPGTYADRATMLAAVQAGVIGAWNGMATPPPPINTPGFVIWDKTSSDPIPRKTARQESSEYYDVDGNLIFGATVPFYLTSEYGWFHTTGVSDLLTPTVSFYAYSQIDELDTPQDTIWTWHSAEKVNDGTLGTFNAYGLPLQYRKFSLIGTGTRDDTDHKKWLLPNVIGDIGIPDTPDDLAPTIGPENDSSSGTLAAKGYYIKEVVAVVKWDKGPNPMKFVGPWVLK
jgi:hypothetical protein